MLNILKFCTTSFNGETEFESDCSSKITGKESIIHWIGICGKVKLKKIGMNGLGREKILNHCEIAQSFVF